MTANNSHGSAHRCLLFLAHTAGVAKQTRTQFSHESQYLVFNDHNSRVFRQASGHIVMQRDGGAACQEGVGSQQKTGSTERKGCSEVITELQREERWGTGRPEGEA